MVITVSRPPASGNGAFSSTPSGRWTHGRYQWAELGLKGVQNVLLTSVMTGSKKGSVLSRLGLERNLDPVPRFQG